MRLAVIFLLLITLVDTVVGACVWRMVCVLVLGGWGVEETKLLLVLGCYLLFIGCWLIGLVEEGG